MTRSTYLVSNDRGKDVELVGPPTVCQTLDGDLMSSLADEHSAVLAAVQDASRRLRRCRKRHPGQRLRAALCPSAGRDEGMAVAVEQRDGTFKKQPMALSCSRDQTASGVRAAYTTHRAVDRRMA